RSRQLTAFHSTSERSNCTTPTLVDCTRSIEAKNSHLACGRFANGNDVASRRLSFFLGHKASYEKRATTHPAPRPHRRSPLDLRLDAEASSSREADASRPNRGRAAEPPFLAVAFGLSSSRAWSLDPKPFVPFGTGH